MVSQLANALAHANTLSGTRLSTRPISDTVAVGRPAEGPAAMPRPQNEAPNQWFSALRP